MKPKVLIVGGGPAGSACGIELARRGIETLVFECDTLYRDGLNFDAQKALVHLGLFEEIKKKAKVTPRVVVYGYRGKEIVIDVSFLILHRSEFDQIIRNQVEMHRCNVLYETKIEEVKVTSRGVSLKDHRGKSYDGDILVLATGARTQLAESLGFAFEFRSAAALRGYVPNSRGVNAYLFYLSRDISPGYAWAFPCPDGTLNVGVIYFEARKPDKDLHELLRVFIRKTARGILDGADFIGRPRGFQLRTGLRREPNYADRVLLVGENVSCTYDLSGEGIGKAMESGILAAETLADAPPPYCRRDLAPYQAKLMEAGDRLHRGYTTAMRAMGNPLYNFLFTQLFARSSKAKATLASIVREERCPQEIFSVRGLLKTLIF